MTRLPVLQAEALVVHIFISASEADSERYLRDLWAACCGDGETQLGMSSEPIAGMGATLDLVQPTPASGLLAARMKPQADGPATPYLEEALLRRVDDTYCLSVMREPAPQDGAFPTWTSLDQDWTNATGGIAEPNGMLGEARLYLCRLVSPGSPVFNADLGAAVRARYQLDQQGSWWESGVLASLGFALWEASAQPDDRTPRRIVVVAAADQDTELSAWAWFSGDRELPRFGHYLLNAAKLRYERRRWAEAEQGFRRTARNADQAIGELLESVSSGNSEAAQDHEHAEPARAELVQGSRHLATLQRGSLKLAQASTWLAQMRTAVRVATANMAALSDDKSRAEQDKLGGLFADDRELGSWLIDQLDADTSYLEATRERVNQFMRWAEQLTQWSIQQRQETLQTDRERLLDRQNRFNLALTGVVSAILMTLAAVQSLQYSVRLPPLVKPAVITTLGAVALLASLMVLRAAAPKRPSTLRLVWAGIGATTAAITWVAVSAVAGDHAPTGLWASGGFVFGVTVAALGPRLAQRPVRRKLDS